MVRLEKEEEEKRGEGVEGGKEEEEEEEEESADLGAASAVCSAADTSSCSTTSCSPTSCSITADFGGLIRREGLRFRVDLRLASLSLSLSRFRSLLSTRASSLFLFCRVTDFRLTASLSLSRAPPARKY